MLKASSGSSGLATGSLEETWLATSCLEHRPVRGDVEAD